MGGSYFSSSRYGGDINTALSPLPAPKPLLTGTPFGDEEDNLFATHHDGELLSADHGGPLRFVCHHLYAWKSAKWIDGIELLPADDRGFWERNGYHKRGDPWDEERYAYQE